MANLHINGSTEIDNSNKTLLDLLTEIRELWVNVNNFKNILSKQGICVLGGSKDVKITTQGNWASIIIYSFGTLINTNSKLYQYSGGGIKILEAGLYKIGGTINCDAPAGSFEIFSNKKGYICIQDFERTGNDWLMNNYDGVSWPLYLEAGEIIYPAFRARNALSNVTLRQGRSILTIERVLHM